MTENKTVLKGDEIILEEALEMVDEFKEWKLGDLDTSLMAEVNESFKMSIGETGENRYSLKFRLDGQTVAEYKDTDSEKPIGIRYVRIKREIMEQFRNKAKFNRVTLIRTIFKQYKESRGRIK